ncbi:MAG TPA: ABC transporter permease subunit [Candidatus Limnocylindria bacterium]|nr:ABC transporter permease subunit [Candidatus Limnocylindria bacterium]
MTAAIFTNSTGFLPGFGALVRRELTEWRRARRTWVVFLVSTVFLTLGSLNSWLISHLPADVTEGAEAPNLDPLANFLGPITTHVFVITAIFAMIAIIAAERESGTLAWTASKPVSRSAIWMSKFASASGVLWVVAGVLPLAAAVAVVVVLYGAVPVTTIAAVALGMAMIIVLYTAVALAASTVVTSQAAVAGITLVVISVAPMIAQLLPDPTMMPTSILDWSVRLGVGQATSIVSVIGWGVTVAALVAFSLRRMERLEL